MAEIVVTQDELALRRRARRRLVGAVAIALTVVVALPMLFDSEPKPLGPEVDIRIPAQDTPFESGPGSAPTAPEAPASPEPLPAEPTLPPANSAPPPASPVVVPTESAKPPMPEIAPASEKTKPPVEAKSAPKPDPKPEVKALIKPVVKAEAKPEPKPESKAAAKPPLKPDSSFSSQGYFLQLGAFASESNAQQLHDKAVAAGFKAVMLGANGQFRVRVGPIPQHERALEMQAKLKAKGFSPVLLGP